RRPDFVHRNAVRRCHREESSRYPVRPRRSLSRPQQRSPGCSGSHSLHRGGGTARQSMRKQVQPPFVAGADPLAPFNTADAVEYLNQLNVAAAAQLVGQVPDARGVGLLEQPELVLAPAILMRLPQERASALLVAMADDRAADLLLALEPPDRARLIAALPESTQQALRGLMSHPAGTAGRLMTTEFVSVLANQRGEDVRQHVREVEHSRETIYAIYVLGPATRALLRVVTLRRLITSDPGASILDVAQANPPVAVAPDTDQEEVARLI